jgi:polyisoprenoid-binding protein YceI
MAWKADYAHSHVQFSVRHMMISTVRGQFDKFEVNADINDEDVTRSKVEVKIDAASINTKQEQRDAHLRSADFFDAEKYPYITFKSKRGEVKGKNHGHLIGDLTIRDVTKEVVLDVEHLGQAKSPWGAIVSGFHAHTKINRKDWNLNWNVALETGGWLVSDEIGIDIEIEFTQVPETVQQAATAEAAKA